MILKKIEKKISVFKCPSNSDKQELWVKLPFFLKVQSCKLYNNKCMIASTQIRNTEIFAFTAFLVFQLLSRKVMFTNRKDNRNC